MNNVLDAKHEWMLRALDSLTAMLTITDTPSVVLDWRQREIVSRTQSTALHYNTSSKKTYIQCIDCMVAWILNVALHQPGSFLDQFCLWYSRLLSPKKVCLSTLAMQQLQHLGVATKTDSITESWTNNHKLLHSPCVCLFPLNDGR